MNNLDKIYRECRGSEKKFKNKSVLFIGSESYDAAAIIVIQGLHQLGFAIYTLKKPNINSWFCNEVVESLDHLKFDFVLSNLHWGTRWSYYERYGLYLYPKVLIDGDDNRGDRIWRDKYTRCVQKYMYDPPEAVKDMELHPYRWMERLGDYEPDVVFTTQKVPGDRSSFYLPYGIHEQYKTLYEGRSTSQRDIDFAHILGSGVQRKRMERRIRLATRCRLLPGVVYNEDPPREIIAPDAIEKQVANDPNVHSYHRWTLSKTYFRILNRTKVLIYPGVTGPTWESKRPWETYASGALVLLARPTIDVTDYPITQICEYAVYDSFPEFLQKCWFLYSKSSLLDRLRATAVERARKYFSPKPIANYFLARVHSALREGCE